MSGAIGELAPDLVIGVGNSFRCDDGAGPTVARMLAARGYPARPHESEGSALLDIWEHCHRVVVVDAMRGETPGATLVFDGGDPALSSIMFVRTTHDLGLAQAISLGNRLGRLPHSLSVIAIAGASFGVGEELSPAVAVAVSRVTEQLAARFEPSGSTIAG